MTDLTRSARRQFRKGWAALKASAQRWRLKEEAERNKLGRWLDRMALSRLRRQQERTPK
jgi:hypothetical protein